jgi:hypothetical protein
MTQTRVGRLVLVSLAALGVQVSLTDYGPGAESAAGGWLLIGCLLLWLVYRKRSRVARGMVVVPSLAGAVVYGMAALGGERIGPVPALIALAYLAQALPLLTGPVRRHVQLAGATGATGVTGATAQTGTSSTAPTA